MPTVCTGFRRRPGFVLKLVVLQQHHPHPNSRSVRPPPVAALLPAPGKRGTSRGGPSVRHQSAPSPTRHSSSSSLSGRETLCLRGAVLKHFFPPPIVFCFHLGPFFPRTKELSHTPLLTRNAHTSHNRSNLNCGEEWEASEKHRGVPADSQGLYSNNRGPEYLCISTITRRQSRHCGNIRLIRRGTSRLKTADGATKRLKTAGGANYFLHYVRAGFDFNVTNS